MSILVICLLAVITFPALSVAVANTYPFALTVKLVVGAVAEFADVCAFANVVPYPAFLVFDVVTSGYVIVAVIFWFVHAVVFGVIVIVFAPTTNPALTFTFVVLLFALSYTFVHK